MIEIKKGKEPKKLLYYRQQKDAFYEQMDKDVRDELLERLLQEQGHICAYCMKKIPEKRKLPVGVVPVTIEHWLPRNPDDKKDVGQGLDYKNMFAVCSGNRGCGCKEKMTCDAHRSNEPIKIDPRNVNTLRGITYTSSGRIRSSDEEVDKDINERLNLNSDSSSLPENRKRVLQTLIDDVRKKHTTGDISLYCKRRSEQIRGLNDPKMPYVGIVIWWLEKHIKE